MLQAIPQSQADESKGEQAALFGAALGWGHAIGGQGVGAFHVGSSASVVTSQRKSHP